MNLVDVLIEFWFTKLEELSKICSLFLRLGIDTCEG